MKTVKTTSTAYQIGETNHLIIGYSSEYFFVKTKDGIMQYSIREMIEIYSLEIPALGNIMRVLK